MELVKPYKDIAETMKYLLMQVKESLSYADNFLPGNMNKNDMQYLFDLLKANTTYMLDGPDTELLQSMPTLFDNNYWGIRGAGDCDCFVITVTACCIVLNAPCKIVLAGRSRKMPVHIYNLVKVNDTWQPFDLTADMLGVVRNYPHTQVINLK